MSINPFIQKSIEKYKEDKIIYDRLVIYFEKNLASRMYAEICNEEGWNCFIDHLTVRTYNIDIAAKEYESIGWKYDETIEYKNEGWWAKIYRNSKYPNTAMFIDQSYDNVSDPIIKKWVDKFGDKEFHHLAFLLPEGVEIEEAINKLKEKGIKFPGNITGPKGTRLRQIFTQTELVNGEPYSVIELAQRNKDPKTGYIYRGFIADQADSLMKDSVL